MITILIAGAGASGMCAAIIAARQGAHVILLEKNDIAGKKISMTGNGRCNITNEAMSASCYNLSAQNKMEGWLQRFGVAKTLEFMKSLGVVTQSEEGYIYPISGQAVTVQNAMIDEVVRLGVEYITGQQLKKITPVDDGGFEVKTTGGLYKADKVIIATGGLSGPKSTMSTGDSYYIAKSLGMNVTKTYPALVALLSDDKDLPSKYGVRMMAGIRIKEIEDLYEYGEVQITSKGISGIPVLQLSGRVAQYMDENKGPVTAFLDFFPTYSDDDFANMKKDIIEVSSGKTYIQVLDGISNHLIGLMILSRLGIKEDTVIDANSIDDLERVIDNYRNVRINIVATSDYASSQVTKGGVDLNDLTDDLESVHTPGVYVVGELADVDGRCGGYNLQWAFTSGYIAGMAAAGR
ncbi:aminoacetone oxidase family FAD-binding enzyme [Butyrivibrio fibrisolvens]|uniref:aminoacetone oxidase family FAD-binding enzyme n=1 Tax=Butyrivibrio fibrisolvens TaxID=831 RepID=UPI000419070E|nr:aminoacetone oxidase family FAD-binding enzyme [Butyrivibrio fibrisolvens]